MAAKTKTIQYIKAEVECKGWCIVAREVVEEVIGGSYPDDDDYETAVQALVDSVDWATDFSVDWASDTVCVNGPKVFNPPPW